MEKRVGAGTKVGWFLFPAGAFKSKEIYTISYCRVRTVFTKLFGSAFLSVSGVKLVGRRRFGRRENMD